MFGLSDEDIAYISGTLSTYEEITEAKIFGSRALGTYRNSSDIDIAIFGKDITMRTISSLKAQLEELSHLPYFCDIVDATHLTHKELQEHIKRAGIVIYQHE
ncbi:MAG: nucleotidyltransferase domain-containing protein [Sphaerochaetaceae bacterium]|nr:nucleotidyltransferase domain-containing protein [Sphaerochaetaceae bacterium]